MYYIGIDGGGTKTQFALYNQNGELLSTIQLGTCHILQVEKDEIITILKTGLNTLIERHPKIKESLKIGLGLAGYGQNPTIRKQIETICDEAFSCYPYFLTNDVQTALNGALNGKDGIMVIAGTGSIALAKIGDKQIRCGGWGYSLGDEGSAYWIAKKLLAIFCKQSDGRLPKSYLYQALKSYCGIQEDHELIPYINTTLNNERNSIAKMATIVGEAADHQDPYALNIYEEAASEIAEMINNLALNFQGEIMASYVGGVFNSQDHILIPLKKKLNAQIHLEAPQFAPEYGAYLLAKNS